MYRKVVDVNKILRKEELKELECFKSKNPNKDVQVYYVMMANGCGFSYIATTDIPTKNEDFGNYIDITNYKGRLEEF